MNKWLALVLLMAWSQTLHAQICNGSLGDPLINITFGSGTNPGGPLSAATTSYQYVANDCPGDGFYALRNSTSGCFGNTWHSITDHTGNTNGYFMLVNASIQPSAFYLDTVHGLCGNTTYEFAAWVVNMLKPNSCGGAGIQPDLTFTIEKTDGTILQSYNTNNIPPANNPQWKQYGFFFTTPASSTNVVLRIVNNSQGGCGNDLALDDITFRPCGPQISTSITGTTATMVSVCEGTAQTFGFNGNVSVGFNMPVVQWQQSFNSGAWTDIPGATSVSFTKDFPASTSTGTYAFRLSAAESGNMNTTQCRIASTPLVVQVMSNPSASANNNGPVCEGSSVVLKANASNASWVGPNGFVATGPEVNIDNVQSGHAGKYYVTAINGTCSRYDSTTVVVYPNPVITTSQNELNLCEGDTAMLTVMGAETYLWSPTTGTSAASNDTFLIFPKDSVVYTVIGKVAACTDTATISVFVAAKPVANAGSDKTLIEGSSVQLSGTAGGDSITYYWRPVLNITGEQTLTPHVSPLTDTSYILYVISQVGCGMDTDTVKVHVYKKLMIPNAFSPNDDGINDQWRIGGIETYPKARIAIYNRYGQPVLQTDRFVSWGGSLHGKPLPVGIYYYLVDPRNGLPLLSGYVVLLR